MTQKGVWLLAGTPVGEPYPCRCHESRWGKCSPMWCPCAGRVDEAVSWEGCCAARFTPEVVAAASAEYQRRKAAGLA